MTGLPTVYIDPNVRVHGNQTYAGYEDTTAIIRARDRVLAVEPESGLCWDAEVVSRDEEHLLVYLSVDWQSARPLEASE